jgi:hypothetical protein
MVVVRSEIIGSQCGVRRCSDRNRTPSSRSRFRRCSDRNRTPSSRSRFLSTGAASTTTSAALGDRRTSRPRNTLGQLTGVSYRRTPADA